MPVILKETNRKGVFSAHRREDELPFAELHSPAARTCRISPTTSTASPNNNWDTISFRWSGFLRKTAAGSETSAYCIPKDNWFRV